MCQKYIEKKIQTVATAEWSASCERLKVKQLSFCFQISLCVNIAELDIMST